MNAPTKIKANLTAPKSDPLNDLSVRQKETDARHQQESKELERMRGDVYAVRRPLHLLIERRTAQAVRVKNAQKQRAIFLARDGEFVELVAAAFGDESSQDNGAGFGNLARMHPELFIAQRAVAELDRWLPPEVEKLAAIEADLKAYAAEHQLEYLLSPK